MIFLSKRSNTFNNSRGFSIGDYVSPKVVGHIKLPLKNKRLEIYQRWSLNDFSLIAHFGHAELTEYFIENLARITRIAPPSLTWNEFYNAIARAGEERRNWDRSSGRVSSKIQWTVNDLNYAMGELLLPSEQIRTQSEN